MQFLKIAKDLTLSDLSNIVGERNVDSVLNANSLERTVNIGQAFVDRNNALISTLSDVDYQKKINILNQFVGDSDIYEKAALGTDGDWKTLSQYGSFTDALKIPEVVVLPSAEGVLGNGEAIPNKIYRECIDSLRSKTYIDPTIFAEYNSSASGNIYGITSTPFSASNEQFGEFKIPWGDVCLYSSLSDTLYEFPVYPQTLDDGVSASYDEMGEMLYQYEPWKVYKSSGPREMSFTFEFHRDMWTGDHRDGKANELIRGCMANCYPMFNGSLVNVSIVTLYIKGQNYITGIMTDCKVNWDGPLGLDGFYLKCELSFTITEISPEALNYDTMRTKGLIS